MKRKLITALAIPVVIAMLAGCKGKSNYEFEKSPSSADSAQVVTDSTAAPKLVKTADIKLKVKNVQQSGENISALVSHFNGMVMHHDMSSTPEQTRDITLSSDSVMHVSAFTSTADMTVRIPSEHVEEFLNTVSHMGVYVNERKMDIEDRSLDYLEAKQKLENRKQFVASQNKSGAEAKTPEEMLDLKDNLIDREMVNRRTDGAVKYSVISLNLYQSNTIVKEVVANDDVSNYNQPFFSRMGIAIISGWYIFSDVLVGAANLWAFGLAAIICWLAVRWYLKKRAVNLVKPAQ